MPYIYAESWTHLRRRSCLCGVPVPLLLRLESGRTVFGRIGGGYALGVEILRVDGAIILTRPLLLRRRDLVDCVRVLRGIWGRATSIASFRAGSLPLLRDDGVPQFLAGGGSVGVLLDFDVIGLWAVVLGIVSHVWRVAGPRSMVGGVARRAVSMGRIVLEKLAGWIGGVRDSIGWNNSATQTRLESTS